MIIIMTMYTEAGDMHRLLYITATRPDYDLYGVELNRILIRTNKNKHLRRQLFYYLIRT